MFDTFHTVSDLEAHRAEFLRVLDLTGSSYVTGSTLAFQLAALIDTKLKRDNLISCILSDPTLDLFGLELVATLDERPIVAVHAMELLGIHAMVCNDKQGAVDWWRSAADKHGFGCTLATIMLDGVTFMPWEEFRSSITKAILAGVNDLETQAGEESMV